MALARFFRAVLVAAHGRRATLWLGVAVAVALGARPAVAIDPHKTAAALAVRAAAAYEAGKMVEAAEMYQEAFRNDPSEPNYLYGAARAEHSGRDLVKAERDYAAFIALATADASRVQKAKGYLAEVQAARAEIKVTEAKQAEASGDHILAASLYLEAWRLAPDLPEPLLRAALIERASHDQAAAAEHLKRFLSLAAPDNPSRATAQALLKQMTATETPAKSAPPPAPVVVQPPPPPPPPAPAPPAPAAEVAKPAPKPAAKPEPPRWQRPATPPPAEKPREEPAPESVQKTPTRWHAPVGWTFLSLGVIALGGGGYLAYGAHADQVTLDSYRLADGKLDASRITLENAAANQVNINNRWIGAAAAGGVSVVALTIGIWALASDSPEVTVAPGLREIALVGRF